MANRRRVVISGWGTYNPLGNDVESTWQKVKDGASGIDLITQFDTADHSTKIAAEVKDFDAAALFGRKEIRRLSRPTQLVLAATRQALDLSGVMNNGTDRQRVGVIVGSGMGSLQPVIDNAEILAGQGSRRVNPFFVPMMLADTPAAAISIEHGLNGPNMSIATACATANNAIGEAAAMIHRGAADVMIAGGTEACILPLGIAGFSSMKALSTRNDEPQKASRPFDKDRDGFVTGEGAAVLVLEALDHALARGAVIYGELLGYGTSADAYHITQPADNGAGAVASMRAALADAGLEPEAVGYINAHGTSTKLNDEMETAAIKQTFGSHAYKLPISSTKSMHGHMLGATGALEAILCLKGMEESIVPPTINLDNPDEGLDLDYVPGSARQQDFTISMSNAFGFGGHNATIILGKWQGE